MLRLHLVLLVLLMCERDAHTFGCQFARWYDFTTTTSHHLGYGKVKFTYVMVDMCTVYDYSLPRVLNNWSTKKNLLNLTRAMFQIEKINTNEKTIILNCAWHIDQSISNHFDYHFKNKRNLVEKLTTKRRNLVKTLLRRLMKYVKDAPCGDDIQKATSIVDWLLTHKYIPIKDKFQSCQIDVDFDYDPIDIIDIVNASFKNDNEHIESIINIENEILASSNNSLNADSDDERSPPNNDTDDFEEIECNVSNLDGNCQIINVYLHGKDNHNEPSLNIVNRVQNGKIVTQVFIPFIKFVIDSEHTDHGYILDSYSPDSQSYLHYYILKMPHIAKCGVGSDAPDVNNVAETTNSVWARMEEFKKPLRFDVCSFRQSAVFQRELKLFVRKMIRECGRRQAAKAVGQIKDRTNNKKYTDEDEELHQLMKQIDFEYEKKHTSIKPKMVEKLFWEWNAYGWDPTKHKFTTWHVSRIRSGSFAMSSRCGDFHRVVKEFLESHLQSLT